MALRGLRTLRSLRTLFVTWRPVDGPEGSKDPKDSKNLKEPNPGPSEDRNEGDRDNNDIQAVEGLKK